MSLSETLQAASCKLSAQLAPLHFSAPVHDVYNPLEYALEPSQDYLARYANTQKRVLFLGMNPGPFGMTQTGVPFGEISAVRDWLKVRGQVNRPRHEHPKRPILGFDCPQSEVSGRRLWGLFQSEFQDAEHFFAEHFVLNYCPLVFMNEKGANLTPDKLPTHEMAPVHVACMQHLQTYIEQLQPQWLIGVGNFAQQRGELLQKTFPNLQVGRILHPSPASPAANRDWAGTAKKQLQELGIW